MENVNNTPMIFENKDLGMGIKVAMFGDEIYAVGSHLARTLGYMNTKIAIIDNVDDLCKVSVKDLKFKLTQDKGNCELPLIAPHEFESNIIGLDLNPKSISVGQTILVDEAGIYQLILRSSLPKAVDFQKWVCKEVIPSIRKHGMYLAGQENLSNEEFITLKNQIVELTTELNAQRTELANHIKLVELYRAQKFLPIALLTEVFGAGFYTDNRKSKAFIAANIFRFLCRIGLTGRTKSKGARCLTMQGRKVIGNYVDVIDAHTQGAKLQYNPEIFNIIPELKEYFELVLFGRYVDVVKYELTFPIIKKKYLNL